MLIGVLAFVPFFMHMMGYHCDSNKNVMKTSILSFADNFEISLISANDLYNISEYTAKRSTDYSDCAVLLKFSYHSTFFGNDYYDVCDENDIITDNPNCTFALKILNKGTLLNANRPRCMICADKRGVNFVGGINTNNGDYCFSEAYSNNKTFCPDLDFCDVPTGYKFSNTTGKFLCIDDSLCGGDLSDIIYDVDVKLKNIGAKRLYGNTLSDKDYKAVVKLKCDSDLNPQVAFYGIPIFDYKIWLFIFVLGFLIFFYSKFIK
jgi:hypothetical protein